MPDPILKKGSGNMCKDIYNFISSARNLYWLCGVVIVFGVYLLSLKSVPAQVRKNETKIIEHEGRIKNDEEAIKRIMPILDQISKDVSFIKGKINGE